MYTAKEIRQYTFYASLFLYLLALVLPSYDTEKDVADELFSGFFILIIGWMGLIAGYFAWLGNPFLFIAWYYRHKKPYRSLVMALIAAALALSFLTYTELLYTEAGHTTPITVYRSGYWCWVGSILLMIFGQVYLLLTTTPVKLPESDLDNP